jgi:hypothetical protein
MANPTVLVEATKLRREEGTTMSLNTHYQVLINRGRKAGLTTRELYSAMAGRPIEGSDDLLGRADCNGYVPSISPQGQRIYRPLSGGRRP